MFKNYMLVALRNVTRSKGYSALNILGLAIGMSVALLIGLWINYQYSYDKFLPDNERLYEVKRNYHYPGEIVTYSNGSLKLADVLRNQVPEFEYVAEAGGRGPRGLAVNDKKIFTEGLIINGNFLEMFPYPMIKGNRATAMKDPYSIVISQATAKALFGDTDPVGKQVRVDNRENLTVTGIIKDLPGNSTFHFHFLIPFSYHERMYPDSRTGGNYSFGLNWYGIYTKLKPGITYAQVAPKIKDIVRVNKENDYDLLVDVIMQPMSGWHLYSKYENGKVAGGLIEYVHLFGWIGLLVLLIACINFINLITARSEKRAREVGVRKVVGSLRKDLIVQFLSESFFLCVVAFLCALLIVYVTLPFFNALTKSDISIPVSDVRFWVLISGCIVITSLLAGSRPAFYLSSFHPVNVLKGTLHIGKAAALPRKILVVLQFSCSIALIIATAVVYQQIQYAMDRPKGYNSDRMMMTWMTDDLNKNYAALKNELLQKRIVESVTTASTWITDGGMGIGPDWTGKQPGEDIEISYIIVSEDYFRTTGIRFVKGGFSAHPDSSELVISEAAAKKMHMKDPINKIVTWGDMKHRITGVVKDVVMFSPFEPATASMFTYYPRWVDRGSIMYRLSPGIKTADAIKQLSKIFGKYNPTVPFDYTFADDEYAKKVEMEELIGKLAGIFAALAIFISCLGLFGLAAYTAEQRTKEIGIRKVLGASVSQLWALLSQDFVILVLISCVIASPVAFLFLENWLQKYSYRTEIHVGVFVLTALAALIITLATISFQAIKAAIANPIKSLRTE